jgi:hypothetical protein
MKRSRTTLKKIAEDTAMLRAWKAWHREQLEQVLGGPHGAAVAQVVEFLKGMGPQSAPALIALLHEHDWRRMDADVRFVVLHEINTAIIKLREQSGLPPFDDALPNERDTGFLIVRQLMLGDGKSSPELPAK